jgi:hypothetical protein
MWNFQKNFRILADPDSYNTAGIPVTKKVPSCLVIGPSEYALCKSAGLTVRTRGDNLRHPNAIPKGVGGTDWPIRIRRLPSPPPLTYQWHMAFGDWSCHLWLTLRCPGIIYAQPCLNLNYLPMGLIDWFRISTSRIILKRHLKNRKSQCLTNPNVQPDFYLREIWLDFEQNDRKKYFIAVLIFLRYDQHCFFNVSNSMYSRFLISKP